MIHKEIVVSSTKTSLNTSQLIHNDYDWNDSGVIINNDATTIIYLLFKSINTTTSIGVSNLKDKIDKSTLSKLRNNIKYI